MSLLFSLITSSIVGSIVFITLLLLSPITSKVFSKRWHYYCLIVPLVFLLGGTHMAINLASQMPNSDKASLAIESHGENIPLEFISLPMFDNSPSIPVWDNESSITATPSFASWVMVYLERITPFLLAIWAMGATLFIFTSTIKYLKYRRLLLQDAGSVWNINYNMPIVVSKSAYTPMLIGVFKPIIVLPDMCFAQAELDMILAHEIVHYRRKDLFVKLLMLIANAIHWFNPAVYALSRQLNTACELSCDEKVVSEMDLQNRRFYGETILQVLKYSTAQTSLVGNIIFATNLCNSKRNFKRRLISIMSTKKMKKSAVALALAAGLFVISGGFAISNLVGSAISVHAYTPSASNLAIIPMVSQSGSEWYVNIIPSAAGSNAENELNAEEAAQVGARAIERFFAYNLGGNTINMYYLTSMQGSVLRGLWSGGVTLENSPIPTFNFFIDAETGALISVNYNPYAANAVDIWEYWVARPLDAAPPNAQHNYEYAILAMSLARDLNIFNDEIAKARIAGYASFFNPAGEPSMTVSVAMQSINGDVMSMGFHRFLGEDPMLTDIASGVGWNPDADRFDWVVTSAP